MSPPFTILSWNLRHGGGSRNLPRIVLALLGHGADVIVLSEWRRTTGGQIAGALADHGWVYQHCTSPPAGANGLLVASRLPLVRRETVHPPVLCPRAARAGKFKFAEVEVAGLSLIAAHIPCDGPGEGTARAHVFQCVLEAARRGREGACIVVGDLNAGRHLLDEAGATLSCTRLLGQFAAMGYVDAWRRVNPGVREFSWYSPDGGGFRIDHALVSRALAGRIARCSYAHEERESGLSDHSALVLALN